MKNIIKGIIALAIVSVIGATTMNAMAATTTTNANANVNKTTLTTTQLACMQTAVDAREMAIQTATTAYHTAWATALTTRATALHAAWGMTVQSARVKAINDAWKAYNASVKTAKKTFNKATAAAWKTFNTAKTSCKLPTRTKTDELNTKTTDVIS